MTGPHCPDPAAAALGNAFGQLVAIVKEVAIKTYLFKPVLKRLESTLDQITPIIKDSGKLNQVLDRPPDETDMCTERLKEGKRMVEKYTGIRWWKCYMRWFYTNKLLELESSLVRFFQIQGTAQILRDTKETLVVVNVMDGKLNRIERMVGVGVGGGGGVGVWNGKEGNGFVGYCGVANARDFVVGFDEPLWELKRKVLDGGERQRVVVVSGPGGCGKTTLAKMLCHDREIKGMFKDNIFFITVSETPDLRVIIGKLFQHKGGPVPKFQKDEEAIDQLELMLNQTGPDPILLVLDDVWSGLESLIDHLTEQIPGIKILVTSRFEFPGFGCTYKLKLLKDQYAMDLFRHSAFRQDGSSSIPNDLVDEIVRECGGLPLALEVVGRSLCGKPKETWKLTLKQWSEGQSFFSSEPNSVVLKRLQTSLNSLDETHKKCYLDLASFPEDKRIPATALIDLWVGLYNLDEDGEAIAILHELSTRSLVNQVIIRKDASEISDYYNEHFATQHDLLRELAIHQSSLECIEERKRLIMDIRDNDLPKWWIEQGLHPILARLVSISTDDKFCSNWHNMQLPMAEALVLNIQTSKYALPQFMEKLDKLKVLIITNHGFSSAEFNNLSILGYLSSLERIRLEHVSISSISDSILRLRNLQKVSFIMCKIAEAFCNCNDLVEFPNLAEMLPNLTEIVFDYCNDLVEFPAWLCHVRCLKKLSITNCHEFVAIPEEFGALENLEVLRLRACTKLLELPESIGNLKKLGFLDISDCISMNKLPGQMGDLYGLAKIHMSGCHGLSELPLSIKDLEQLKHVTCDEETFHLWEHYKGCLRNLEIKVLKEEANLDWLFDIQP